MKMEIENTGICIQIAMMCMMMKISFVLNRTKPICFHEQQALKIQIDKNIMLILLVCVLQKVGT